MGNIYRTVLVFVAFVIASTEYTHAESPAFSESEGAVFTFESSSVSLMLETPPFPESSRHMMGLYPSDTRFNFKYRPGKRFSLFHRVFGPAPLNYTELDIRRIEIAHVDRDIEIFLRDPSDTNRTYSDGPLIIINRESGQVSFFQRGYGSNIFSLREMADYLTEFQQWTPYFGQWKSASLTLDLEVNCSHLMIEHGSPK